MTHDDLATIIGPLAHRLTQKQVDELEPLTLTNPAGLAKTAASIENDPNIDSAVGALLGRIRRGDIPQTRRKRNREPVDHYDRARQLYHCKLALLDNTDLDWSDAEKRQHAVDYALDHCAAYGPPLFAIETWLRDKHDAHRSPEERDFERDTPHRRSMIDAHQQQPAETEDD